MSEIEIVDVVDSERGCGWRKPRGLYLVTEPQNLSPCGRLPLALDVCPTCGHGIKPVRSWTWVDAWALFSQTTCALKGEAGCASCPLKDPLPTEFRCGLLWIGEKFYRRPEDWTREVSEQGVSRRITGVPRGFGVGRDWVLVAHRKVVEVECRDCGPSLVGPDKDCRTCGGSGRRWLPAIFHAFKPRRVEYVVEGNETEEELLKLKKQGVTPVRVRRAGSVDHPEPFTVMERSEK